MKIDSHQHFWKLNTINHDWIDDTMSVIKGDFLPRGNVHTTIEVEHYKAS